MCCLRFLLVLVPFLFQILSADEENPYPKEVEAEDYSKLIDFNGLPSGVIAGCVNVISGHYFENEEDLATAGTNPIALCRYYDSGSSEIGELKDYWDLNLFNRIKVKYCKDCEGYHGTLWDK